MSGDMNDKIKQIADILGQENVAENLKPIITSLMNNNNSNTDQHENRSVENNDVVSKIKGAMDRLSTSNDPRVSLLTAVKPFLNNNRQKKIANCIKLFHMTNIAKIMDENES